MVYCSIPLRLETIDQPANMSRTSKKYFDEKFKKEIWSMFWSELEKSKSKSDADTLLNGLLTPNEKLMLEKRLAVIYLLQKEIGPREIGRRLDVTRRTISFLKSGFKRKPSKKKHYSSSSTPPKLTKRKITAYKGRGRWDFLNSQ